jgi:hypothetical protein
MAWPPQRRKMPKHGAQLIGWIVALVNEDGETSDVFQFLTRALSGGAKK